MIPLTSPPEPRAIRPAPPPLRLPRPERRPGGFVVSLVLHGIILLLIARFGVQWVLGSGDDRKGPRGGGGGAGGSVHFVDLPAAAPPARATPVPQPVVHTVPPPTLDPAPMLTPLPIKPLTTTIVPVVAAVGTASDGTTGQGTGTGGGMGAGVGTGLGNDSGPGRGGDGAYLTPPGTRVLIMPPGCARGSFTVQFSITAEGRVTRVGVDPQPKDAACRQQMLEKMKQYEFTPARTRDGRAVAVTYSMKVRN